MKPTVIETRLSKAARARIDTLSASAHTNRNAIIEELIRIGLAHVRREQAAEKHVGGQMTLSEAARQARLTVGAMKQYLLSRAENPALQLKGWHAIQHASDDSTADEQSRYRLEWRNGVPLLAFEFTYNRYQFKPGYPKEPKTLGERIRKARMDKAWMVKELAERLGVTPATVINWEKYDRTPMPEQMKRLQAVLGVNIETAESRQPDP